MKRERARERGGGERERKGERDRKREQERVCGRERWRGRERPVVAETEFSFHALRIGSEFAELG